MDFSGRRQLRSVFQHWEIIIDRFPVATARRFTWCISINASIRKHLGDLCLCVWSLFMAGEFQQIKFHDALRSDATFVCQARLSELRRAEWS